jgi:hypothetical protein
LVVSSFRERNPGAGDQVHNRAGHNYFTGTRQRTHPGSHMNCDTPDVISTQLTFSCVESAPDLKAKLASPVADGHAAANRTARPVKSREYAVSGGLDFAASVSIQFSIDERIMSIKEIGPFAVP